MNRRMLVAIVFTLIAPPCFADLAQDKAMLAVDKFAKEMEAKDADYKSKEPSIIEALPLMKAMYPPQQWESQVKFLYAIASLKKESVKVTEDEVLAKYFSEERALVGASLSTMTAVEMESALKDRFELLKSKDMSKVELAARKLAAATVYFPNDEEFLSTGKAHLRFAVQLQIGELSEEAYKMKTEVERLKTQDAIRTAEQQRKANESAAIGGFIRDMGKVFARTPTPTPTPTRPVQWPVRCTTMGASTTCY